MCLEDSVREAMEIASNINDFKAILTKAVTLLKECYTMRRIRGLTYKLPGVVLIDESEYDRLIVIGDVHGDLNTLNEILHRVGQLGGKDLLVFLGDYIDRGPHQIETLVTVALLLMKNPDKVVVLRGNHEPPRGLEPYPHDYIYQLMQRFPQEYSALYELSRKLFDLMPAIAIIEGRALLVHGGPPIDVLEYDNINDLLNLGHDTWPERILEQLLWNDPDDSLDLYTPSYRGAGFLWGRRVTDSALKLFNVKIIIRGHEPAYEGYKFNHDRKVLTLFSRKGPPYMNVHAAYIDGDLSDIKPERVSKVIRVV